MATEGSPQSSGGRQPGSGSRQSTSGSGSVITAAAPGASSWKGRHIKRFRLIDEIGAGAMGRVFVAEDTVIQRLVALKLLPSKHRDGRINHRTERLVREARSAATLEHPNVVTIYEIDSAGGVHYIAMEHVEGGNLERLVQMSGPMEIERACQLGAEAAEALAHAHSRGIIHRDIKPANLLLTRSGRCKVADFGLAVFDDAADAAQRARCAGSPHFIAPEVAQGLGCTEASDIYSLGCTLWFLLTGRPPFPGSNTQEVMRLHVTEPLPDIRRWRSDIPPRLLETLLAACEKDPQKRTRSAERLAKTLRTFTIPTGSASASSLPPIGPAAVPGTAMASGSMHSAHQMPVVQVVAPPEAPKPFFQTSIFWAGIGTLAAAILIAMGVWLARSDMLTGGNKAAPPTPLMAAAPAPKAAAPRPIIPKAPVATVVSAAKAPTPADKPSAPAPIENPVKNASLEDIDAQGVPTGWTIESRFKSHIQVIQEGANHFLRLTNDDPTKNVFAEQTIPVDPSWTSITVSVRIRALNFTPGTQAPGPHDARLAVSFRDDKGARVGGWPLVPLVKESTPWAVHSVKMKVPETAVTMQLQTELCFSSGTADFDDVKIIPHLDK